MRAPRFVALLAVGLLVAVTVVRAAEPVLDGIWKLSYVISPSAGLEFTDCVLRLETRNGALQGEVLASVPGRGSAALTQIQCEGDTLRLRLKATVGEQLFEGRILPGKPQRLAGTLGNDRVLHLAWLTRTAPDAPVKNELRFVLRPAPEPLRKLSDLNSRAVALRQRISQTLDPAAGDALVRQLVNVEDTLRTETPQLYLEVLAKHADGPAVFDAVLGLLRTAGKRREPAERIREWMQAGLRAAELYGPRWRDEMTLQAAEVLGAQPNCGAQALEYARLAEKGLTAGDAAARQARVLKALAVAQRRAGDGAAARQTEARIDKWEAILDRAHDAAFPPLKVPQVAGEARKGGRVPVVEFFTGTQCRGCAATYLALRALQEGHKPEELILLQYHVPATGADPLANPDAEARWAYYRKKFPLELRTTPALMLDGQSQAAGLGHMSHAAPVKPLEIPKDARKKYNLLTELIDRRLEAASAGKVSARVERQGERLVIKVEVRELKRPGETQRLRVALAEDTVRHVGPNDLRFHHRVVRAMPGGAEGVALRQGDSDHEYSVQLDTLREQLQQYLDQQATLRGPWPNANHPLNLRSLWLVAFIQDDATGQILQGIQVKVAEE